MSARSELMSVETCKAGLDQIEKRRKLGKLSEAEADAARHALLARLQSQRWGFGADARRCGRTLLAPAAVFLLVVGIGGAAYLLADVPPGDATSLSQSGGDEDSEMLAKLADYSRSIDGRGPALAAEEGKLLPDVDTMIERLATRLKDTPEDVKGWQLLGWSHFQMQRYDMAASAFATALALDPSSAVIKRAYGEAQAKASGGGDQKTTASFQTGAGGKQGNEAAKTATSETPAASEQDAQIRSMVDGLAARLESAPRDVEGWTRLMRSRVVLGEKDVAATAFRKALDIFKDDFAASSTLTAAAIELGLKAE